MSTLYSIRVFVQKSKHIHILELIIVYSLWPTHACSMKLFLTGEETFTQRAIRIKVFDWNFESAIELTQYVLV